MVRRKNQSQIVHKHITMTLPNDDCRGQKKNKGRETNGFVTVFLPHNMYCQFFNITTVCNTILNTEPQCSKKNGLN